LVIPKFKILEIIFLNIQNKKFRSSGNIKYCFYRKKMRSISKSEVLASPIFFCVCVSRPSLSFSLFFRTRPALSPYICARVLYIRRIMFYITHTHTHSGSGESLIFWPCARGLFICFIHFEAGIFKCAPLPDSLVLTLMCRRRFVRLFSRPCHFFNCPRCQ
jgi:hypothetical protein